MFALMYFLMIRPQKKKMEENEQMRSEVTVNDEIVTIGGIRGVVEEVTEDSFVIRTGNDGNTLEILKQGLSYVVTPIDGYPNAETTESTIEFVDETEDSEKELEYENEVEE